MKHYGDITKLSGYDLPPVDIITGGSPCQNLSIAGNRKGLEGEQSSLFYEQIRIVKEMREAYVRNTGRANDPVPVGRYLIWENVYGAFTSGNPKGGDFQIVLQEIVKVVCKEAPVIPVPSEGWPKAGCINGVGDNGVPFSVAWRLHDLQYWGIPQRRRRVCILADFAGSTAPWILFDAQYIRETAQDNGSEAVGLAGRESGGEISAFKDGLRRDNTESRETGQGIAERAEGSIGKTVTAIDQYNQTLTGGVAVTINATSCSHASASGPMVMTELERNEKSNTT